MIARRPRIILLFLLVATLVTLCVCNTTTHIKMLLNLVILLTLRAPLWCGLKCQETHSLRRSEKYKNDTHQFHENSRSNFFSFFIHRCSPFDLYAEDSFGLFRSVVFFYFIEIYFNLHKFYGVWIRFRNISRFLFILCANLSKKYSYLLILFFFHFFLS